MTAILPNLNPCDTCDPGQPTGTTAVRQPGLGGRRYCARCPCHAECQRGAAARVGRFVYTPPSRGA